MRLLVTRHGRTDWNKLKKIQGQVDIPLNTDGIQDAKNVKHLLENEKIDVMIVSPLIRTKETACIINENRNIPIIYDERIIERDFGEFSGLRKTDFNSQDFWIYDKNISYEKAENVQDFYKRIFAFLDDISLKYKDKTVLLVVNGGVSVVIHAYFHGIPNADNPIAGALKNCEVREFFL